MPSNAGLLHALPALLGKRGGDELFPFRHVGALFHHVVPSSHASRSWHPATRGSGGGRGFPSRSSPCRSPS
ncbi:hypothetical protein Za10_1310 [Zymomonas mobilis subsp. mobilis NCIMB 11163]|uniref:hypothetical protein n=1 Tax=Zymomonas mobilis TaxID=542 RepID=UPI0001B70651|nr:hypothetical protein [Zymomonas mobilis]ACV75852.1 hypothetical protein Za10_1310 [Zymomonas mobilis subsp. mobilis NCIMB 11163]